VAFRPATEKEADLSRWRHYRCGKCGARFDIRTRDPLPLEERLCPECYRKEVRP
jgi:DNA-directed RNA polymerase subunit RPC12/RpoP